MLDVWELGHVVFLCCFFTTNLPFHNMRFQSLVEIRHAYAGIDYRKDEKNDGYDGKTRQVFPGWQVELGTAGLVHPGKFEDKVCQCDEVAEYCDHHSKLVLTSSPECC